MWWEDETVVKVWYTALFPGGGLSYQKGNTGCLHPQPGVHLFNKCLLNTYYVPGTNPGIAARTMNKTDKDSYLTLVWGTGNK